MNKWCLFIPGVLLLAMSTAVGQDLDRIHATDPAIMNSGGPSNEIDNAALLPLAPISGGRGVMAAPLLQNGGFENGFAPWRLHTNGGGYFTDDPPGEYGGRGGHLFFTGRGSNVQLNQSGILLESRTQYRLRFSARSNSGHDVSVSFIRDTAPYTQLGLVDHLCDVGTTWTSFDVEFTTPKLDDPSVDARLMFWLAPYVEDGDEYVFDNVELSKVETPGLPLLVRHPADVVVGVGQTVTFRPQVQGEGIIQWQKNDSYIQCGIGPTFTTPPFTLADTATTYRAVVKSPKGFVWSRRIRIGVTPGPVAIITNSGFEQGTAAWGFYTNGEGDFSTQGTPAVGRIRILKVGDNIQLYQANLEITGGVRYRISFRGMSPTNRRCGIVLIKHKAPYTNYGLEYTIFDLTASWKTFSKEFVASGFSGNAADARLMFWIAPHAFAGDEFFFDDIVIEPVSPPALALGRESEFAEEAETSLSRSEIPTQFQLEQNYPNPFNPSTTIRYALPTSSRVRLSVYDMLGREVATLVDGVESSGYKSVVFSSATLASGLYLYRIEARSVEGAEPFISVGRMMLLK